MALKHAFALLSATVPAFAGRNPEEECAVSSGQIGEVAYRFFSRGRNCATMSDLGAIEAALHDRFKILDAEDIPDPVCKSFNRDGGWEGWVLYGRAGVVDLTEYCGPSIHGDRDEL